MIIIPTNNYLYNWIQNPKIFIVILIGTTIIYTEKTVAEVPESPNFPSLTPRNPNCQ